MAPLSEPERRDFPATSARIGSFNRSRPFSKIAEFIQFWQKKQHACLAIQYFHETVAQQILIAPEAASHDPQRGQGSERCHLPRGQEVSLWKLGRH
jgi:hypothetical protein